MNGIIGIRREDKNIWERRTPLIPEHVRQLKEQHSINTIVQAFPSRAFSDDEFREAGAEICSDIPTTPILFAVKEIPVDLIKEDKIYIFFSHTIKGQEYNMPLLQKIIDRKSTLIDYEEIKDEKGRRLVFFGHFAGLAGMIECLYGLGQRWKKVGLETPFLEIDQPYTYKDLNEVNEVLNKINGKISAGELPMAKAPYVFGFAGYGNVSRGAQEIFDRLPFREIEPHELQNLPKRNDILYKVIFKEEHLVQPKDKTARFQLQDYYQNPEKYESKFGNYLPYLTALINCIYWEEKYPRLITKQFVKENIEKLKLEIVSDISCDINGSIEFTEKATEPDIPAYVYNPTTDEIMDGFAGEGICDIAVDNLPAELPRNASEEFSRALLPFVPGIVSADFSKPFEVCGLPPEIKKAVIVYKGVLTEDFKYLNNYLQNIK